MSSKIENSFGAAACGRIKGLPLVVAAVNEVGIAGIELGAVSEGAHYTGQVRLRKLVRQLDHSQRAYLGHQHGEVRGKGCDEVVVAPVVHSLGECFEVKHFQVGEQCRQVGHEVAIQHGTIDQAEGANLKRNKGD